MPPEPLRGAIPVKVCGLTTPEDAAAVAALGVWGIGVVLAAGSPRQIDPEAAARVAAAVPPGVARVGVFAGAGPGEIADVAGAVALTHVQLHGGADPAEVRAVTGLPVIEAVRVGGPADLARARASAADLVLLDAAVPGRLGGTGTAFDWGLLEREELGRDFVLAGGLTPANAAEAIARLRPTILDVSSGVESAPGRKDPARVAAFLAATAGARAA
jgi:phosphoribosylanthranilate isomerase